MRRLLIIMRRLFANADLPTHCGRLGGLANLKFQLSRAAPGWRVFLTSPLQPKVTPCHQRDLFLTERSRMDKRRGYNCNYDKANDVQNHAKAMESQPSKLGPYPALRFRNSTPSTQVGLWGSERTSSTEQSGKNSAQSWRAAGTPNYPMPWELEDTRIH